MAHLFGLLRSGIEALNWADWVRYREYSDEIERQRAQFAAMNQGGGDG